MKAKVEHVNKYSITIGDETYHDFEKKDEWEGMVKFVNKGGTIILSTASPEGIGVDFINTLFGGDRGDIAEMTVVKASPDFIPAKKEPLSPPEPPPKRVLSEDVKIPEILHKTSS